FFYATATGAVSNVVFNLLLIPHYSMYGAAVATVLSEFLVFMVSAHCLSRFVSWKELFSSIGVPLAAILLVQGVWIFSRMSPNLWTFLLCFVIYSLPIVVLAKRQDAQ